MSLGPAIRSDVTNASTEDEFFVGFTLPSTFGVAFARVMSVFGKNFLAASDLQMVQFSIFTFHGFVTTGMVVAVFITQVSHHHWSKTAGATVDDCYDVSLHLCTVCEQVLLCCQFFFKICRTHGEENSNSHGFGQLVSSAFSAVVQGFPKLGWCVKFRLCWHLSVETRFACSRPDSSKLQMGHTRQPIFAIVPNDTSSSCSIELLESPKEYTVSSLDEVACSVEMCRGSVLTSSQQDD